MNSEMASPEAIHAWGEKSVGVDSGGFSREATFGTQANALFRKNLTIQKRSWKTNCCIISLPVILFVVLVILQAAINSLFSGSKYSCGCRDGVCGIQFSDEDQAAFCALAHPPEWPGIMQVPRPQYRAAVVVSGFQGSSPATILYTGATSASTILAGNLLLNGVVSNSSDSLQEFSVLTPGTAAWLSTDVTIENAFLNNEPLYVLQNRSCATNAGEPDFDIDFGQGLPPVSYPAECLATQLVQQDSISTINKEIYRGFRKGDPDGNPDEKINEYVQAYDFRNTDSSNFDAVIYYNNTLTNDSSNTPPGYARVSRPMNLAAQAFLRFVQGPQAELPLWFVKEMPRGPSKLRLDLSSLIGPLFYMWAIQLLLPVILAYLVYEKQQNLRIMMKMHGLGDGAYWFISYAYFFALSLVYIFLFVLIGSIINLKFFRLNSYFIQFIFYFIYINLQIAIAFFGATIFSSVATATVVGYLYVLGFGLLGSFFFQNFLEDKKTGRGWIFVMELLPPFSLYRGLYELSQYSFIGNYQGTKGMEWSNLDDAHNGMTAVWGIQVVEWVLFLLLALYLDQVLSSGRGLKKHPLFIFRMLFNRKSRHPAAPVKSLSRTQEDGFNVEMEKPDVARERAAVEHHLENPSDGSVAIICDNLKKVYPGTDGNPNKYAVRGLSLAIGRNECFGMLGPNGAGKTSTINMMIGFLKPTSGTAYVNGLDIRTDMNQIYTSMGVCPQHDLLWETLTAREHLLFYGRLKNLKGAVLQQAVTDSLRSVNLFSVGNKVVGQYSGGMKRRLSVAISLIGNPQVVYMDEPSTGLDPASRYNLWSVVKEAKKDRAIILTTHSMEEAEALCDRLGIFVDGQLQCIGDSKELTARYGGIYVLTVTTAPQHESEIVKLVDSLTPNARKVYGLAGTQKFELPKSEVEISQVFGAMEKVKLRFPVQAWGIADTTLEDVFIKVARDAQGDISLT